MGIPMPVKDPKNSKDVQKNVEEITKTALTKDLTSKISLNTLNGMTAGASYTAAERAMINELKNKLIELINTLNTRNG